MGNGVTGTGSQRVTLASDGTAISTAGFISVKTDQTTHGTTDLVAADITKVAGAAISQGHGTAATAIRVELPTDGTGVVGLIAGTALIGKVGIDQTTPGTTNAVQDIPATSGGLTISRVLSAASTNGTSVKASAGQVYAITAFNTNAAARYLKLYNKASAPTVGSDTPVLTFPIPGNTAGAGFVLNIDKGIAFGTGIALAITTGIADADTGGVAANEIVVNTLYK